MRNGRAPSNCDFEATQFLSLPVVGNGLWLVTRLTDWYTTKMFCRSETNFSTQSMPEHELLQNFGCASGRLDVKSSQFAFYGQQRTQALPYVISIKFNCKQLHFPAKHKIKIEWFGERFPREFMPPIYCFHFSLYLSHSRTHARLFVSFIHFAAFSLLPFTVRPANTKQFMSFVF